MHSKTIHNISNRFSKLISTMAYIGYFPFISGTIGSLIGTLTFYVLSTTTSIIYVCLIVMTTAIGLYASTAYEKLVNKKDPHEIIIDEYIGMLFSYIFLPFSFRLLIIGFALFRFFDIIKPYPIRKFEKLPGGIGIISDDIVAAIYTNIILRILLAIGII